MSVMVHSIWAGMGCAHLVENANGLVLVDCGSPGNEERILQHIHALERDDLRMIYITHAHFDHYGSAAALRRRTGAPIAIHRADAEAMARGETQLGSTRGRGWLGLLLLPLAERCLQPEPTQADILLDGGEQLGDHGLDARVLHLPGHTPGSSGLLVEGQTAFVGDLISTTGRPHAQRLYAHDWSVLAQSLRRLRRLGPTRMYAGHWCRPVPGKMLTTMHVRQQ